MALVADNLYAFMLFPFYGVIRDLTNNSMPGTIVEAFTPFYYRFNLCPNDPNLAARSRLNFFLPLCAYLPLPIPSSPRFRSLHDGEAHPAVPSSTGARGRTSRTGDASRFSFLC